MRFELEDFQADAVRDVARWIRRARDDHAEHGDLTAVGLTAPTGAGKTVIASAVLEDLFFGNERDAPDPGLTVLWVTDDRSLNRQTINKITQASDLLDLHRIRFVGDDDAFTLEPGYVYFAHIQQLQRNSTLHAFRDGRPNDHRTHGAWDMIANTVRLRGRDFVVVVDEAHRGAGTARERGTIVSTIVNGGTTNIGSVHPPAPVVLGISATPERFHEAMRHAGRHPKVHEVPASDVRESGLLKDRILIMPLAEDQSATHTMLTLAVQDLRSFDTAWTEHHQQFGGRRVEPILVVQVEPAASDATLDGYLATLETAWPELSGYAVAHAFGEPHGPLRVGDRVVRYLRPEAIEGDDRVRVVLFKSALTTGWDCPRAEVLVSFQSRESYTEIAQLIGRLVRTPLAARAGGDELLDSVVAYLPGFRLEHVTRVVHALTSEQTVESAVVVEPVTCLRADLPAAFELLGSLVSHRRETATAPSRTSQLMRLAFELTGSGLLERASKVAKEAVVAEVLKQRSLHVDEVEERVRDLLSVDLGVVDVHLGADVLQSHTTRTAVVSERDVEAYFVRAMQQLPDGAASWIYGRLCDEGLSDHEAKASVAAMAGMDFARHVEAEAIDTMRLWRNRFADRVSRLPAADRERIEALWSTDPRGILQTRLVVPDVRREATQSVVRDGLVEVPLWPRHAFVIPSGERAEMFPVPVTGWEQHVLEHELESGSLLTWYRNPPAGRHALAVPYAWGNGDETSLMHPDFLFVHESDDELVVDIVDPHRHDDGATGPKWAGLATYAAEHPEHLRRVVAVIRDGRDRMRGLDLTADDVAAQLALATDQRKVEDLFDEQGFDY